LPKSTQTIQKELVSVLIPARNEEKNILNILSDLQKIDYQNIEIIVFDDESDDDTAKIIKQQAQKDSRIIYIKSDGLPAGWLGKNYACYSLSKIARGSILLFLDADVRIKNDIIDKSINYLRRHKLGLLTIFPKQIMHTNGEKMVVPLMNYILISLLPLIFVRISPFTSHAAGNGQFMMFDKKIYDKYLPHKKLKNSAVEDIESVKYFKKQKVNTACLLGEDDIYCRMYNSFVDAINGFSKNVNHFFGKSYLLSLIFWIITTPGFIFLIKLPNIYLWYFLISTILIVIITSYLSKQNILLNIILLPVHRIVLLYIIINSIIIKIKKDYKWRGRNIYHY
jgi:glycosyltransferase involved in cell wall biosynthesis